MVVKLLFVQWNITFLREYSWEGWSKLTWNKSKVKFKLNIFFEIALRKTKTDKKLNINQLANKNTNLYPINPWGNFHEHRLYIKTSRPLATHELSYLLKCFPFCSSSSSQNRLMYHWKTKVVHVIYRTILFLPLAFLIINKFSLDEILVKK